jgi:chaperonin GroEL (HSP60 family)
MLLRIYDSPGGPACLPSFSVQGSHIFAFQSVCSQWFLISSLTIVFIILCGCSIEVKEIAGRKIIQLRQQHDEDTSVATIVVRASTENVINDVERALDDGIQAVKVLCTDGRLLPGAGE